MTGNLKTLSIELEATVAMPEHEDTVSLFRGPAARRLRKNTSFRVDIPLTLIHQRQWNYFWPRVRMVSGQCHSSDVMLLNGHGDEPIYADGSFSTSSTVYEINPGPLFCPECGTRFEPTRALFGLYPNRHLTLQPYLSLRAVSVRGRRGKTRQYWRAVDAAQNTYNHVFCPNKHPIPLETGLYDRFVIGILGEEPSVVRYSQEWHNKLSKPTSKVFANTQQDAKVGKGSQGMLMVLHPHKNHFPLHLWLYRFWEGQHSASDSWDFTEYVNGLVLLVNPLMPGKSVELLSKFWERTARAVGEKLPVSLAIVLTHCESLIHQKMLPRNIAWNLPSNPEGKFDPLTHCDTSAQLGRYAERTFPKLHRLAKDRFSSVAFFGTPTTDHSVNGQLMHRAGDALMWMLAERQQIPSLNPVKALNQISSQECDHYVFNASD